MHIAYWINAICLSLVVKACHGAGFIIFLISILAMRSQLLFVLYLLQKEKIPYFPKLYMSLAVPYFRV